MHSNKTLVLCILDGYGYSNNKESNATVIAKTPNIDQLWASYPRSLIYTSGEYVGLPKGQMGNSEVGHSNIGAGRVVLQNLLKINKLFSEDYVAKHQKFNSLLRSMKPKSTLHIMGLFSDGGIHSHINHGLELIKVAKQYDINVKVHFICDGRDADQKSAIKYIKQLQPLLDSQCSIASISGRYYAMDRDNRWQRTEKASNAIINGISSNKFTSPESYINKSYDNNVTDEFILPGSQEGYKGIEPGDGLCVFNFRADRMRQIVQSFLPNSTVPINIQNVNNIKYIVTMKSYMDFGNQNIHYLIEDRIINNSLSEVISKSNLTQLKVAETEKYAHVTFFINGNKEEPFSGEDRILIPSPSVSTYDSAPRMSADQITSELNKAIRSQRYNLIVVNYANGDMVGHTGKLKAAVEAVQCLDESIKVVHKACLDTNSTLLVTADHGNCEQMSTDSGLPHTKHTTNPVPFIAINTRHKIKTVQEGKLANIAPTILQELGIDNPSEMTESALF